MSWLIELFFGKWECVIARPVDPRGYSNWLLVCHQHSVTKRCTGYVDTGHDRRQLDRDVATQHVKNEGMK